MAVLIIKPKDHEPKNKDNDPIYMKKCPHCGAIFLYSWNDTEGWIDQPDLIRCPECSLTSRHHWWNKLTKRKMKKLDQCEKRVENKKKRK